MLGSRIRKSFRETNLCSDSKGNHVSYCTRLKKSVMLVVLMIHLRRCILVEIIA
uniref:Uncharacterized protein n=1 Tax=Helianthus annuus TaxID=4232 RepID=A0A251TG00_HELAN